ncbi:putative E3 ubiquitin-protein ligase HERC1 [Portunus trituberculatus]|uniref:Putative E3 ubiquitin-protein ligase HERC1 n=1 Tax=Portunus trituberculatus TaxID=210409 RepID=A0A5B7DC28_PORTR|nr:putative E3 ubiquitin-protein ligase HERC1 [Portunus trituberculatus]
MGSSEATMLRPRPIEELSGLRVVDISAGDSHVLALTHESEVNNEIFVYLTHPPHPWPLVVQVYAWGSNTMGQCGQGHTISPLLRPKKVMGLDVAVHQISAGTTHSIAWTAIPTDRRVLVDAKLPRAIEAEVCEGLSSPLLLPPLASRMSLLYGLLPKSPEDWGQLTYGQRLQLGILVVSLEDPSHVAALLGYSSSEDAPASLQDPSATLPRDLMRTLLANLRFHTEHQLKQILEEERPAKSNTLKVKPRAPQKLKPHEDPPSGASPVPPIQMSPTHLTDTTRGTRETSQGQQNIKKEKGLLECWFPGRVVKH